MESMKLMSQQSHNQCCNVSQGYMPRYLFGSLLRSAVQPIVRLDHSKEGLGYCSGTVVEHLLYQPPDSIQRLPFAIEGDNRLSCQAHHKSNEGRTLVDCICSHNAQW